MNKIQFSVLSSGSSGNATFFKINDESGYLLDCGLSQPKLKKMLNIIGEDVSIIKKAFITHFHSDHFKFINGIEYVTEFEHGNIINCDYFEIIPIELCHDVPCYGFVIIFGNIKIGYITDTAYITDQSFKYLLDLDAIILESNYHESLITADAYYNPAERHLSNMQVECILNTIISNKMKNVILTHISKKHNTYNFAYNAGVIGTYGFDVKVDVSNENIPTRIITFMY